MTHVRAGLLALALAASGLPAALAQQDPPWLSAMESALDRGDRSAAYAILERAAEAGDPVAQAELGTRLVTGIDVAQDFAAGARWLRQSAQAGDARAQNALGRLIFEGLAQAQSEGEALALLQSAAAGRSSTYMLDYASALEASGLISEAVDYYARAAQAGSAEAMTSLGVLYLSGEGVDQDLDRARALFQQAADDGNARAQNNLGLMYARGDGVEQDYERAASLFALAAEQGLGQAMANLGVLYENGFGVPVDEATAYQLYRDGGQAQRLSFQALFAEAGVPWSDRLAPPAADEASVSRDLLAADAGDPVALYALAYRFETGVGRPVDRSRAAIFYRRSAEAGFAPAALNLGVLHARGLGVPQDFVLAYRWLNTAASAGEPGAATLRDTLVAQMSEGQRDQVITE